MKTAERTSVWRYVLLFPVGFVLSAVFIMGIVGTYMGLAFLVWYRDPTASKMALIGRTIVWGVATGGSWRLLQKIWPER